MEINQEIVSKILETVDAGLTVGLGKPVPGQMCVEAAVCYALGLPHSDNPQCVSEAVRSFKIGLNDAEWSSPQARAAGLRRLAIAQLGTKQDFNEEEFSKRLIIMAVSKVLSPVLHAAGLGKEAEACEQVQTFFDVEKATDAAEKATDAAICIDSKSERLDKAYSAAEHAESAVFYINKKDYYTGTDYASGIVYSASKYGGGDKVLADFAESVVQLLIEMESPGSKWL